MDEARTKLLADVCSSINAILVASRGRMTLRDLERDYREVVQKPIPYRELGHSSLENFLRSIPHVVRITGTGNQLLLEVVVNEASRHIMKLVQGQKKTKKSKGKGPLPVAASTQGRWKPNLVPARFSKKGANVYPAQIPRPGFVPHAVFRAPVPSLLNLQPPIIFPVNVMQPSFQPLPANRVYRDRLESLVTRHGLEKPVYSVVPSKNEYYGKVTIGNQKFSSTPESSTDKEKVLELAAKDALDCLTQKYSESKLAVTSDVSLVKQRVLSIVADKTQGIFYNLVESEYQQQYKERLPANWLSLFADGSGIRCEQVVSSWILLPASAAFVHRPLPPVLPEDDLWIVQVDHVEGITIFVHISNSSYDEAFGEFVDNMELFYTDPEKKTRPAQDVKKGVLYVAKITNELYQWERVEVEELLEDSSNVRVRLVDRGDVVDIERDRIFPITKEFAELPCQVIRCELFGLSAVREVESVLLNVSTLCDASQFYAEVVNRENLSVVLYYENGTNANVDVLLQAAKNLPPPMLPSVDSVSTVRLQHVTSSGDVFVQLEQPVNAVVDSLLELLARDLAGAEAPAPASVVANKRYLTLNQADGKWYRANVISKPTASNQVAVYFVDTGNTEIVSVGDLRELGQVCPELESIPDLALRVRLARIPPSSELEFTDRAAKRLRELAPRKMPILMRFIQANPPLVDLYKRVEGSRELAYINTTLEMEPALFAPAKDFSRTPSPLEMLSRRLSTSSLGSAKMKATPSPPPRTPTPKAMDLIPQLPLPPVGQTLPLLLLNVSHPHNFWIQPLDSNVKLENLMHELQEWYNRPEVAACPVPKNLVQVDGYYAAVHQGTQLWHRVKVKGVQGSSALVHLVDYGDTDILMDDRPLYPLKAEFCQLPCQAIQAKLAGVKPPYSDWTVDGILFFKRYEQTRLFGTVQRVEDNRLLVLELIDTSGEDDVYLSKVLLDKKHALPESN